jgi:hypothetical protein
MRNMLHDMLDQLDAFGKFWLILGLASLAAAAAMSFDFGWQVSPKHALFLAVLTVVAAFGPMAAELLWGKGRRGPAIACGVICLPLLAIEFYSHAGYTAGLRGHNIETAAVQNTRFDAANDAVTDDKTNIALWRKQLATLLEQNAWAGTVKADGLRASLTAAQTAIDIESARGGCKAKCLAEMEKKADLERRITVAEQATDLNTRIEATQRILDGKREVAAKTEHKSSAVAHQTDSLKKWVALVANGNTVATELQSVSAEQSANFAMAVAGTGLPAFALFMAGLFRIKRWDPDHGQYTTPPVGEIGNRKSDPRAYPLHLAGMPAEPIHIHTIERITDKALKRWAASKEVCAMLSGQQMTAA